MVKRHGFTIAEVLTAAVIITLVVAFAMPVIKQNKSIQMEAPLKYIAKVSDEEYYNLGENIGIYGVTENMSTAVIGAEKVPTETGSAEFGSYLPKMYIAVSNRLNNPLISRHMIDFYEHQVNGNMVDIGKISFDGYLNLALGLNAMASICDDQTMSTYTHSTLPTNSFSGTIKNASNANVTITYTYGLDPTNIKGVANTAVGQYAMGGDAKTYTTTAPTRNLSGSGNTALGAFSLRSLTSGNSNTAAGIYSLSKLTTGSNNTALGASALKENVEGVNNTAVGASAMENSTSGSDNTAVGFLSLASVTGNYNTAVGSNSMTLTTSGSYNVGVGFYALHDNITGSYNTAVGAEAMQNSYSGIGNTVIGYRAGKNLKDGYYNIAIGYEALKMPASGTTGSHNIAIGYNALPSITTGGGNIAIGANSLSGVSTGIGNIAIGNNIAGSNTNNKLYIGGFSNYDSGTSSLSSTRVSDSEILIYGDMAYNATNKTPLIRFNTNQILIGKNAPGETANNIYFKGKVSIVKGGKIVPVITQHDVTTILSGASVNGYPLVYSDERLKDIKGDNTSGLKEILQLKVKNYTMKNDKKKEPLVGVIAQDLQKVFPNSVYEGRDGYLRIKRDEIFYACVNAIKELAGIVENIKEKIALIEEKLALSEENSKYNNDKISEIEKENKLIEERICSLEAKLASSEQKTKKIRSVESVIAPQPKTKSETNSEMQTNPSKSGK